MTKIGATIGTELYYTEIKSPSGNLLIADEPLENGGKNKGFSPHELLAAALSACTNATLRMYANRKQWDVQEIHVEIDLDRDDATNKTIFTRKISLKGNLTEEQRERMLSIANLCPVHKILTNPIEVDTELA